MVEDMIERLRAMDREIEELKHGKVNVESWLAAIVKKYGEISITFDDIYNSDAKKVKVKNDTEEDPYLMTIYYESNEN